MCVFVCVCVYVCVCVCVCLCVCVCVCFDGCVCLRACVRERVAHAHDHSHWHACTCACKRVRTNTQNASEFEYLCAHVFPRCLQYTPEIENARAGGTLSHITSTRLNDHAGTQAQGSSISKGMQNDRHTKVSSCNARITRATWPA